MRGRDGRGTAVVAIALTVGLVAGCTDDKTESPAPGTTVASSAVTSSQAPSSAMPSGTSVSASSAGSSVSSPASPSVTADPALVAEAKKVIQTQWELENGLMNAGGLPRGTVPPDLKKLMMEDGLKLTLDGLYTAFDIGGGRKSGSAEQRHVYEVPFSFNGSVLALQACRDARKTVYQNEDGSTESGLLIRYTAYFKRDKDGLLKINAWSGKEVPACGG